MNAYQINSFVLLEDSGYRMYPEKFGIKFRDEFSTTGRHLVFDEIDGKSWEEIQKSSNRKMQYITERLGDIKNENDLRANDAFLFNCYNSGLTKQEIINLLEVIMTKEYKMRYMESLASLVPYGFRFKEELQKNRLIETNLMSGIGANSQPWNNKSAGVPALMT